MECAEERKGQIRGRTGLHRIPTFSMIAAAIVMFGSIPVYGEEPSETATTDETRAAAPAAEPRNAGSGPARPSDPYILDRIPNPESFGSPYVALDSPVYEQVRRLASLGYVNTAFLGLRPWTRIGCARMLQEAEENGISSEFGEAFQLYTVLAEEFQEELQDIAGARWPSKLRLDRVYSRMAGISGTPLNDSLHFGQTIYNDFGRPYRSGINQVTGVEVSGSWRRLFFSVRGEYQHASAGNPYPEEVQRLLAEADRVADVFLPSSGRVNRLELLDSYAGMNLGNWCFTLGKQSLWQGVDVSTALMASDNAAPMYMFRVNRVTPLALPGILKWFGPLRTEFFLGATEGHHYPERPYVQGLKFSFKPTPNLEIGFGRTVLFAGRGQGLTFGSFWRAFSSVGDNPNTVPGTRFDVGDRRSEFDFHYRVPKLRNYLAVYGEFMADDDTSPLGAPQRSIFAPGIELMQFPGLPRLHLRVEAPVSNLPAVDFHHGTFFYWNGAFRDGYTNRGNLLGSWIGRDSGSIWGEARYAFSPLAFVALQTRFVDLSRDFLPGGGHTTDIALRSQFRAKDFWTISFSVQYERWRIPALAASPQRNIATILELSFSPRRIRGRKSTTTLGGPGTQP